MHIYVPVQLYAGNFGVCSVSLKIQGRNQIDEHAVLITHFLSVHIFNCQSSRTFCFCNHSVLFCIVYQWKLEFQLIISDNLSISSLKPDSHQDRTRLYHVPSESSAHWGRSDIGRTNYDVVVMRNEKPLASGSAGGYLNACILLEHCFT